MKEIIFESGLEPIKINQNGDCLYLPLSDNAFYEKFAEMLKYFDSEQKNVDQRFNGLKKKHEGKPDDDFDMIADYIYAKSELCADIRTKIDGLFGNETMAKAYPGIQKPDIDLIMDFFEKITPVLNECAKERNQKIDLKYNRNRKGARSK